MLTLFDPLHPYGGYGALMPQGAFGNQPLGRMLPLQMDPVTGAYASAQFTPQGAWGNVYGGGAPAAGGAGYPGGQGPSPQSVLFPQDTQDPEIQTANAFVQDASGAIIKRLHEFLQANLQKFSPLADAIPLVQRAAELYEGRDYPRAYAQAYQAYRAIGLVRAKQPDLPAV